MKTRTRLILIAAAWSLGAHLAVLPILACVARNSPQEVVSRLLVEALDADAGHPNSILRARMPPDGRQLPCPPRPSAYRVRCPAAFVSLPVPRLDLSGEPMPGIDALGLEDRFGLLWWRRELERRLFQ